MEKEKRHDNQSTHELGGGFTNSILRVTILRGPLFKVVNIEFSRVDLHNLKRDIPTAG